MNTKESSITIGHTRIADFDKVEKLFTPAEFLKVVSRLDASDFKEIKFLVPRLGSRSFGKFRITYNHEPKRKSKTPSTF